VVLEHTQLHELVETGYKELDYKGPTTIQENAIPAIFNQKDVLVIGEENQDRTLAYLLPLLSQVISGPHGHLRVLILAGTQQSAIDIYELLKKVGDKTRLRSVLLVNREEISEQIQSLRQGAEIVIACPSRLIEALNRGALTLTNVESLVLDQADQLIPQGILVQVKQIIKRLPLQRQNVIFSKSLSGKLQDFCKEITHQAVVINPGNISQSSSSGSSSGSSHILFPTTPSSKDQHLYEIIKLRQDQNYLIVTWSIQRTSQIIETLKSNGLKAVFFDPSRHQANSFGNKTELKEKIFVTCEPVQQPEYREYFDVVIFYDLPKSPQQYIRHTRLHTEVKQSIQFISLVTNEETNTVRKIERILGQKFQRQNPTAQQRPPRGHRPGRSSNFRGKSNSQVQHNRNIPGERPVKPEGSPENRPKQNINRQNKKNIK
jgi:ATP-dependent RNA helicase RhlE